MDDPTARFTGRMGLLFEADGHPRIAGRIFAHLLVSDGPCSLDELARTLRVSKASASTNARLLAATGVLERVSRPGDRHDYYLVAPDLFTRSVAERLKRWERFTEVLGEARRTLPNQSPRVRARLQGYEAAYTYLVGAIGQALDRWEQRHAVRRPVGAGTAR